MNATTTIDNAIAEARNWIVAGTDTDNADMKADHEAALVEFDECVADGFLALACNPLIDLARKWASNDRSGFAAFDELTDLIGERHEFNGTDGTDGFILRRLILRDGRWVADCGWDGEVQRDQDADILVEAGLLAA